MSGGFFRGTSADQDTRFSNKQAKLLKSQKFAPELEHLVDIGKVKMDVMRPWIATRVTELLGFEDEVLINFIYGLLDGKEVNGKQVQISLTGFMEKNTTKFMKELWTLLLSAQSNASGVPQQFLDAKEEETRKKQEEMDRIANEIQKKREKERENRELEQDRLKKMASGVEAKSNDASMESGRLSRQKDDKEYNKINGNRGRYRERSRSISKSSDSRGSISSDRSPRKRSLTSRQRHPSSVSISPRGKRFSSRKSRSPVQRRLHSPYRRRSRSPVRHRSPSPRGRRSPSPRRYRRSPSPRRYRRSPTPTQHQRSPSPVHRRSPSPVRRRSPYSVRRRSPSPSRYRSPRPVRHRSPPTPRRRSPSPSRRRYRRSTTPRRRSPSPVQKRSFIASHRSSSLSHRRSQSPYGSSSPSPVRQQELRRSSASIRGNVRSRESSSPAEADGSGSSDRKLKDQKDIRVRQRSSSSERSPVRSKSPPIRRKRNDRGYISPYESPVRPRRERTNDDRSSSPPRKSKEQYKDNQKMSKEDGTADVIRESGDHRYKSLRKESSYSSSVSKQKYSPRRDDNEDSIEESGRRRTTDVDTNAKRQELKRDKSPPKGVKPEGPLGKKAPTFNGSSSQIERQQGSYRADGRESKNVEDSAKEHGSIDRKADHKNGTDTSGSEETERQKTDHKRKSKQRKSHSHKHDIASNDSYSDDSEYEDRKEAKRRRKEAKKLRKEEKRRKREERRQRRRERRAEKLKSKDQSDSGSSDDEHVERRELHRSDDEGNLSEEKKLEIELRNKALESLKAKKGINH